MTDMKKESLEKNDLILKVADDKLAKDITILEMDPGRGICDYFIIMTGRNKNHTQAIADAIEDALYENEIPPLRKDGFREGSWILLDCGETLVHIFTSDQRDFYNLEGLWSKETKGKEEQEKEETEE